VASARRFTRFVDLQSLHEHVMLRGVWFVTLMRTVFPAGTFTADGVNRRF